VYWYEVDQALINPEVYGRKEVDWDGIVLSRVIVCKYCEAEDDYQLTGRADLALMSCLALIEAPNPVGDDTTSVRFGRAALWDGTAMQRPSEGLQRLRALAEAEPASGEAWRRLGNLAQRYHKPGEAEEAFREAVEVDEHEAEAAHSLAEMLWSDGRGQEALQFAVLALKRLPNSSAETEMRQAITASMLDMIRTGLSMSSENVALMAAWSGGERRGQPVVNVSSIDLRKVQDWPVLAEFLTDESMLNVSLTDELPDDDPTLLERHLASRSAHASRPVASVPAPGRPFIRNSKKIGRNRPCPCGSGKKYKKCCGR